MANDLRIQREWIATVTVERMIKDYEKYPFLQQHFTLEKLQKIKKDLLDFDSEKKFIGWGSDEFFQYGILLCGHCK